MRRTVLLLSLFAAALSLPAAAVEVPAVPDDAATPPGEPSTQAADPLVGTFRITATSCASAQVTGSWFRMVTPSGNPTSGPWVSNSDSPCSDKTYTPQAPGKDGGLVSGSHQPQPQPPFDGSGHAKADRITKPQRFYGVDFGTATNPTDPQTNAKVDPPQVLNDGGKLSGDLRSFAASWNNQHFNQGSPKPDGQRPGNTGGPTGTYSASSGTFSLEWTSQIVGGPFNNFTGKWHLEGKFVARASGSAPTSSAPRAATPQAQSASAARSARTSGPTGPVPTHPGTGGPAPLVLAAMALATALGARVLARRAGGTNLVADNTVGAAGRPSGRQA